MYYTRLMNPKKTVRTFRVTNDEWKGIKEYLKQRRTDCHYTIAPSTPEQQKALRDHPPKLVTAREPILKPGGKLS